jgi:two-component system, chemotaxis family, response regulator PixG
MPTVNGYSVCKFLRETNFFKTTPIIILTSKDTIVDRTRAKLAGATDFLSKPPETQELLQVIRQYITDISLG